MHRRRRGGFTLIELLVVVGIIIFLVGLTVTVSASAVRHAEVRQTETTLRLLDMAVREWETESGRKLTWRSYDDENHVANVYADVNFDTAEVLILTEVLDVIERVEASRQILARIDSEFMHRYEAEPAAPWLSAPERVDVAARFVGSLTVLDAWGKPIYATHPGRLHDPDTYPLDPAWYPRDPDGTIRTWNEQKYGVARNRRICFVSAGPDGEFGYFATPPNAPDGVQTMEHTQDNLFSYTPDRPDGAGVP